MTTGNEKDARLWYPATGEEIAEIREEKGFRSASFGPDGKSIVLLSYSGTVRLCDTSSGRTIKQVSDPNAPAMSAAFASDGVVVASAAGSVGRVWQMNSTKTLCELRGHQDRISGAVLSPDAAWVFTQGKDNTARLWETATGRNVSTWNSQDNQGWGGVFSPDGTLLVHGGNRSVKSQYSMLDYLLDLLLELPINLQALLESRDRGVDGGYSKQPASSAISFGPKPGISARKMLRVGRRFLGRSLMYTTLGPRRLQSPR